MTDGLKPKHREAMIRTLAANPRVERAVLFGSRVMGTFTTTSDVDIALFGSGLTLDDQASLSDTMAELPIPQRVDILLFDSIKNRKLIEHIREHGVEWYVKSRSTPNGSSGPSKGTSGMKGEWQIVEVGSLCEGIFDGPHATPPKTTSGPIFLGISSLNNGRIALSSSEYVSEDDFVRWTRRVQPQKNDVVFSYETRLGEAALIPDGLRCCLGRRMALMRPKQSKVDPRFLLYAYIGPEFQKEIRARTVRGSTVDRIPLLEFPKFSIRVAPLKEQQAIACILGALDDKIELNRRMNRTLEAMAQAIFKSWFVDFDPVLAKAEARDLRLPKMIADLFPDSLQNSEIGNIPREWKVGKWGDEVTLEYGKSLQGYATNGGPYPVYGTNGRIGQHTEALCKNPGVIIGRKGAYRGVHFSEQPFFVIDTAFYVKPRKALDLRWAYYVLLREDINGMDSGSAIPSTSRGDFYNIPLLSPPYELQRQFHQVCSPFWSKQSTNDSQSHTLAALRDALLPKLITGELRVADAERIVGRAI